MSSENPPHLVVKRDELDPDVVAPLVENRSFSAHNLGFVGQDPARRAVLITNDAIDIGISWPGDRHNDSVYRAIAKANRQVQGRSALLDISLWNTPVDNQLLSKKAVEIGVWRIAVKARKIPLVEVFAANREALASTPRDQQQEKKAKYAGRPSGEDR